MPKSYCYNATALDDAAALVASDREDAANTTVTIPLGGATFNASAFANMTAPTDPAIEEDGEEDFSSSDRLPLDIVSDMPCSANLPCEECVGDCNEENDACEGDLLCFVRPKNDMTAVPGCAGTGIAGSSYCWHPVMNTLNIRTTDCSKQSPCQKCEGGCSNDKECADGLACFSRQDMAVVPGCDGNGFRGFNFCYDPTDFGMRHLLRH